MLRHRHRRRGDPRQGCARRGVGAVDALTAAIRDGRPADGFVAAIEKCGAVLAEHFPRASSEVRAEELPDRLVEI